MTFGGGTGDLDLDVLLDRLERHGVPVHQVEVEKPFRWAWRSMPFGPCPRCRWPANCLGPNGSPWHAYCWGNADSPGWWSGFVLRKVRAGEWTS